MGIHTFTIVSACALKIGFCYCTCYSPWHSCGRSEGAAAATIPITATAARRETAVCCIGGTRKLYPLFQGHVLVSVIVLTAVASGH